eukprot:Gb_16466 [translate_table: standard]
MGMNEEVRQTTHWGSSSTMDLIQIKAGSPCTLHGNIYAQCSLQLHSTVSDMHFALLVILEKGDYILMQGKPFIKKSGWRKIAFFFNISFEIKDKTIQFDQNSNVLRAEFVIRASMHSLQAVSLKCPHYFYLGVEDFLMGGPHVTVERKDLVSQIMTFQAQLRQGLKPEHAR